MPSQRELDHEYRLRRLQVLQNLSQGLFRAFCICVPSAFLWLTVRALSGRQTFADIQFKAIADLKINEFLARILPWGVGGSASLWALGERHLRRKHIRRSATEISALQQRLDPQKRSSSLTVVGKTSPEDI